MLTVDLLGRALLCIFDMIVPLLGRAERSSPDCPQGRAVLRREGLTVKARA